MTHATAPLSALQIYQEHLDRVSSAIWARDFDTVADAMTYPHRQATMDGVTEVSDRAALLAAAASFRDGLHRMGATAYHRVGIAAAFRDGDPDRIAGLHKVYILNGGTYILPPYDSEMVLDHVGNHWLGSGIRVDVRNRDVAHLYTQPTLLDD